MHYAVEYMYVPVIINMWNYHALIPVVNFVYTLQHLSLTLHFSCTLLLIGT